MVEIVDVPGAALGGLRRVVPFEDRLERIPAVFQELMAVHKSNGLLFVGPEMALYRMVSETDLEVLVGVPMDDLLPGYETVAMPAGRALWRRHRGDFSGLPEVYGQLFGAAEAQGLTATGVGREIYRLIAKDSSHNVCDVYVDIEEG